MEMEVMEGGRAETIGAIGAEKTSINNQGN